MTYLIKVSFREHACWSSDKLRFPEKGFADQIAFFLLKLFTDIVEFYMNDLSFKFAPWWRHKHMVFNKCKHLTQGQVIKIHSQIWYYVIREWAE